MKLILCGHAKFEDDSVPFDDDNVHSLFNTSALGARFSLLLRRPSRL